MTLWKGLALNMSEEDHLLICELVGCGGGKTKTTPLPECSRRNARSYPTRRHGTAVPESGVRRDLTPTPLPPRRARTRLLLSSWAPKDTEYFTPGISTAAERSYKVKIMLVISKVSSTEVSEVCVFPQNGISLTGSGSPCPAPQAS